MASSYVADEDQNDDCNDDSISASESPPPRKKAKRLCRFQSSWVDEFSWCQKVPGNIFQAHCRVCTRKFSIAHGGKNDLTVHGKSDVHLKNVAAAKSSSVAAFFVRSTPTGLDKQVFW